MKDKEEESVFKEIPVNSSIELSKENKPTIKKRDDIWDNYKGILSFTVVFAHYLYYYLGNKKGTLVSQLFVLIYIFHMPAFIFCSGFFSKSDNAKSKESLFKLVIHYFIFNTSMMIFMYFYNGEQLKFLSPYYSYWYLLSLIFWRIIIIYVDIENQKSIILKCFALALINGYSSAFSNNIFSIRRTIAFFPFFVLGYLLPKDKFKDILNIISSPLKKTQVFIFFILLYSGVFYCIRKKILVFSVGDLLMTAYGNFYAIKKRFLLFVIAFFMLFSLLLALPNRKIPFFTMAGRNSLYIYLFHRVFPIFFRNHYGPNLTVKKILYYGFIETILIMIVFGNDFITQKISKFINYIYTNLSKNTKSGKAIRLFCLCILFFIILVNPIKNKINRKSPKRKIIVKLNPKKIVKTPVKKNLVKESPPKKKSENKIQGKSPPINIKYYTTNILTNELKQKLNSSIRISYIGDLILLKQQIISAYNESTKKYDFNDIFKYTKDHFHKSDLSIGVFEGPTAGGGIKDYSNSNYNDGISLYLNFPDEFVSAIKNSGINYVTTSNEHLLDKGIKGALRTLDILDKYNISHIGSYRNDKEKKKKELQILNIKGVKIAFLAYTQFVNYNSVIKLYQKFNYLTSFIPTEKKNNLYKKMLEKIKDDVKKAKNQEQI